MTSSTTWNGGIAQRVLNPMTAAGYRLARHVTDHLGREPAGRRSIVSVVTKTLAPQSTAIEGTLSGERCVLVAV